jgi:hypothetical protein
MNLFDAGSSGMIRSGGNIKVDFPSRLQCKLLPTFSHTLRHVYSKLWIFFGPLLLFSPSSGPPLFAVSICCTSKRHSTVAERLFLPFQLCSVPHRTSFFQVPFSVSGFTILGNSFKHGVHRGRKPVLVVCVVNCSTPRTGCLFDIGTALECILHATTT